jgi:hypothetical protein
MMLKIIQKSYLGENDEITQYLLTDGNENKFLLEFIDLSFKNGSLIKIRDVLGM